MGRLGECRLWEKLEAGSREERNDRPDQTTRHDFEYTTVLTRHSGQLNSSLATTRSFYSSATHTVEPDLQARHLPLHPLAINHQSLPSRHPMVNPTIDKCQPTPIALRLINPNRKSLTSLKTH
jgi:hypothetical protein